MHRISTAVVLFALYGIAYAADPPADSKTSPRRWLQAASLAAPEAHQAAAADENFVYAITNTAVAKYDRRSGQRLAVSTGEAKHLNSGFLSKGKLYCAHSNYPQTPELSEIKVLDVESMQLSTFKGFGNFGGSLTWAVLQDDHWWCNFARYGAGNTGTFLVKFDTEWQEKGRWTYPPTVIRKLGQYSLSGGLWQDGKLLVTGHDDPVLFRLRLPSQGTVLELIDTESVPFTGQGIASDTHPGGLIGINRANRQVIFAATGRPWTTLAPHFSTPKEFIGKFGSYQSPLQFADGTLVRSSEDWKRRRNEIQKQWTGLLGAWPELIEKPQVEVLESSRRDNFMQHRIRFLWTPQEYTTAYLLIPDGQGKRPAVLTVYYEPETAVGLKGELRDFAYQLARRGFVTLSIGTTEASAANTYALYYPDIDHARVQPLSMLAYAAANAWHVLASRPEVDANRIGVVGHSFGGKWALFAGALFDRFAAVAVSDPGIMFDTHPSVNYWEPWYLGWHPRPWRAGGLITPENPARGLYPKLLEQGRDLHELHALLAPRPFLVSGGEVDPPQRWEALNHLVGINEILGQQNRVGMTNRPKHSPDPESNGVIYAFFEHFLR